MLAAVDATTPPAVVDELWRLACAGEVSVEQVVGAIPLAPGESRSFAVVVGPLATTSGECSVTAVVRGSAVVDIDSVGGSRRFDARGALPWMLAEFGSVVAVTLGSGDAPARGFAVRPADALPIERGATRGDVLVWSVSPLAGAEHTADDSAADDSAADDSAATDRAAADDEAGDDTVVSQRAASEAHRPGDDTVIVGRDRSRDPQRPPAEVAEHTPPAPPFTLRFAGGETHVVLDTVIVGRNPRNRGPRDGDATLVAVPSPHKSVSTTHVRFEAAGRSVTVTDEHSTNGTIVTPDGAHGLKLRPGDSLSLGGPAHVELGDGIIIEIIPPDER